MKKYYSTWTCKTLKNEYAAIGSTTWTCKVIIYNVMNAESREL